MITLLLHLFRLLLVLCASHRHLVLENLSLRHQIAVYRRTVGRPRLRTADRLVWVDQGLARVAAVPRVRDSRHGPALAATALPQALGQALRPAHRGAPASQRRDHRPRPQNGRCESPVGRPRIHGELLKLGIEVAERTVSRLISKRRTPPSQTWRTFLANHVQDLVSIGFLHRSHHSLAGPLRTRRARPPPPARRPLQRHRTSHRRLDRPADRRRVPGRFGALSLA